MQPETSGHLNRPVRHRLRTSDRIQMLDANAVIRLLIRMKLVPCPAGWLIIRPGEKLEFNFCACHNTAESWQLDQGILSDRRAFNRFGRPDGGRCLH